MRPVSDKQIKFIAKLVKEKDTSAIEEQVQDARNAVMRQSFSVTEASALIDVLLDQPKVPAQESEEQIVGGIYEDGDDLYRVYFGRESGRMLAKKVTIEEDGATYTYAGAASRVLSEQAKRLPVEEVGSLGIVAGNCLICGRDLSDPESLDRGIGPICAQNYEVA